MFTTGVIFGVFTDFKIMLLMATAETVILCGWERMPLSASRQVQSDLVVHSEWYFPISCCRNSGWLR